MYVILQKLCSIHQREFNYPVDRIEENPDACKICQRADQQELILLCDNCNMGWHTFCLTPALIDIPEGKVIISALS